MVGHIPESPEEPKIEKSFDELMREEGNDDILGLDKRLRKARREAKKGRKKQPQVLIETESTLTETPPVDEPISEFERLAAEDEHLYLSHEEQERRGLERVLLERFPYLAKAGRLLDSYLEHRDAYRASPENSGNHAYVESRNSLLVAATRALQAERPHERNQAAHDAWERNYEHQLDALYVHFIEEEQKTINEVDEDFDAVEGLLIDPFLVQTFGSRISERYGGPARGVLNNLREPTFQGYEGLFMHDVEVPANAHAREKVRALEEARREQYTAEFAKALGYEPVGYKEKRERYGKRRKELLSLLKHARTLAPWTKDYKRRFLVSDVALVHAIRTYALPQEKRRALPKTSSFVRAALGGGGVRAATALSLLAAAVTTDVMREASENVPERPRVEEVQRERVQEPRYDVSEIRGEVTAKRGAIGALDALFEQAHEFPWFQEWMTSVYAPQNHSQEQHNRQLEGVAGELGFLHYMPTFDESNSYAAFSAILPAGSSLKVDNAALYLVYPDGRERALLMRHRVGEPTVAPFGSEDADRYHEARR